MMRNLKLFSVPGLLILAGVFVSGFVGACWWNYDAEAVARQAQIDQMNNDVYQTFISN